MGRTSDGFWQYESWQQFVEDMELNEPSILENPARCMREFDFRTTDGDWLHFDTRYENGNDYFCFLRDGEAVYHRALTFEQLFNDPIFEDKSFRERITEFVFE